MVGLHDPERSSGLRNVGVVSSLVEWPAICAATAHHESARDRVTGNRFQSGSLRQSNRLLHRSRNGKGFTAGHPFIDRFFDDGLARRIESPTANGLPALAARVAWSAGNVCAF